MSKQRKIVDARSDERGRTTHVRFDDNRNFTPVAIAMPIVARGDVKNAHVVEPDGRPPYIRTNPDDKTGNNLDEMSKDS